MSRIGRASPSHSTILHTRPNSAYQESFAGSVAPVGTLTKQTQRSLSGSLTFFGTTTRAISRGLTGSLTFVGTTTRTISRSLANAALSCTGTLSKGVNRTLSGAITFSGTIGRSIAVALSGALTFVGTTTRSITRSLTTATLSFVGALGRGRYKAFTATVSFIGTLTSQFGVQRSLEWVAGVAHTIWDALANVTSWIGGTGHTSWMVVEGSLVPTSISTVATQYIYVEISATQPNGTAIDPTSDTVSFAFLTQGLSPTSTTTWYTGSWATGTPYAAQCLVGPSGGITTLSPSATPYSVWVQVNDDPETAVLWSGSLQVT